ncbi:MAG: hypothetical protein WD065_21345 [Planctomycetaceae bacterium]
MRLPTAKHWRSLLHVVPFALLFALTVLFRHPACGQTAFVDTDENRIAVEDDRSVVPAEPQFFRETSPDAVFDAKRADGTVTQSAPATDAATPPLPEPVLEGTSAVAKDIDGSTNGAKVDRRVSLRVLVFEPYENYRSSESMTSWLPGSGQHFGWLSFAGSTYEPRGDKWGIGIIANIHLLGGPESSPVPPRLFDFGIGLQRRDRLSEKISYDLSTSIGAYSDFEGSARDGVRYISHAVGMFHIDESTDFVFGVDYLDRDDLALLPVVGVSLRHPEVSDLRFDLIFPRPRIDYVLSDEWQMYLACRLGGGTWDIEFPGGAGEVMTYRDLRLLLGFEHAESNGEISGWEFGYVFSRRLEFRGDPTTTSFDDAFMLQWFWRR